MVFPACQSSLSDCLVVFQLSQQGLVRLQLFTKFSVSIIFWMISLKFCLYVSPQQPESLTQFMYVRTPSQPGLAGQVTTCSRSQPHP
mmetsp:Transcript_48004/g.99062  ORF Transcript_48004/g.99062 Transcript_48004/m.99062 type:complete len:87 (+) Transcript_48004:209-469(+)